MKYNGKDLNCNNFREVLKDYSVDIQDVVRSALMDGVDISEYISMSNPYKLDQIRLAMKENLSPIFFNVSGKLLYQIRLLKQSGVNLKPLVNLFKSSLSDIHIEYILNWVRDGVDFSKVQVELIPIRLLEAFDRGLRSGVEMRKFLPYVNSLSVMYLDLCVQIEKLGKDSEFIIKNGYNMDVVECFHNNLDLSDTCWKSVQKNINNTDELERVKLLISLVRNGVDIEMLQVKQNGNYKYSTDCLKVLIQGYKENINISELMKETSPQGMEDLISEIKLHRSQKISGRFVKKSN